MDPGSAEQVEPRCKVSGDTWSRPKGKEHVDSNDPEPEDSDHLDLSVQGKSKARRKNRKKRNRGEIRLIHQPPGPLKFKWKGE